eukprot:1159235-Pelagomonas_calceolata.AAC.5
MVTMMIAADMGQADSDDEQGDGVGKPNNMTWLTRSDLTGLPSSAASKNPMVEEAIRKANRDVPEVTQVWKKKEKRDCVDCPLGSCQQQQIKGNKKGQQDVPGVTQVWKQREERDFADQDSPNA